MRILYIHQHFALPTGTTGTRSYEFARRWVKAGHEVTVLTGHYDIGGLEYSRTPQFVEGIKVVIAGTKYSNKQSFLRRIVSFLGFMFWAFITGLKQKKVDVIYATSTPLTVGTPAMLLKWFKRIPFVFEVRDQWPESVVELGIIKNRFVIFVLSLLEKTIYHSSSAIVAVSEGMAKDIQLVAGEKPVCSIPNGCDLDIFSPDIDGSEFRKKRNWNDKLVLLHAGAMGKINGLEFIIEVAEKIKKESDILFVFVGQGKNESILRDRVNKLNLTNVEFIPAVSKHNLSTILAASDIAMAIIGNFPIIERHASLNKFYDGLSAGKPVLLNYSGWQREIIEDHNAGLGCKLCDIDEFVEKVLYLNSNRQQLKEMSYNARQLAVKRFDRNKLAQQLLEQLQIQQEKT